MNIKDTKWIAVDDLPAGYVQDCLVRMVKSPLSLVCVVATLGFVDDWSAYVGWPAFHELKDDMQTNEAQYHCVANRFPEGVAAHGDKLSESEAVALFPDMSCFNYRI